MVRLLLFGALAALFFSSTFVLNRVISLEGGHWFWSAGLRYAWMILLLAAGMAASGRARLVRATWREFLANPGYWTATGSIGFGVFYGMLCLAAAHAPGWVVATTWQSTILATPLILYLFRKPVPARGLFFAGLVFCGIVLVNLEQAASVSTNDLLWGVLPVLVAAVAYPLGNQLTWEARFAGRSGRRFDAHVLDGSFSRVLLLSLGSIPYWLLTWLVASPPSPTAGQAANTLAVAFFSGVVATSVFLKARHAAKTPYDLAAVDATQSLEVVFSLLGEVLLLGAVLPGPMAWSGIALAAVGLILYTTRSSNSQA